MILVIFSQSNLALYIFGSKLYKIRARSFKALRLSKVKFQDPFITLGRRAGEFGWLVPIQLSEIYEDQYNRKLSKVQVI